MTTTPKKQTDEMGEISGFGGGYEQCCRDMLEAGVAWLDAHPESDPQFSGYGRIYGVVNEDNDDAAALTAAIIDAAKGEATGAQHHAVVKRCLFIKKAGWDEYVRQCTEQAKGDGST